MKNLRLKPSFLVLGLLVALSVPASLAVRAEPQLSTDAVVKAAGVIGKPSAEKLKLSQEGHDVYRAVRGARVAIFNSDINTAIKLVETAQSDMKTMSAQAPKYATEIDTVSEGPKVETTHWIAVDGTVSVSDDFVATPEKATHLQNANAHLKDGKHAEAMEQLKLADVDVGFTRLMLPMEATDGNLNTTADMLKAGKYYEANVALKAIEDSMRTDTVSVFERAKG
jgi:TolA-binding protein